MPSLPAAVAALSKSRDAMATTSDHSPFCIAGITLTVAIFATPRTAHRTLSGMLRVSKLGIECTVPNLFLGGGLARLFVHDEGDAGVLHLLPGLLAPMHRYFGIGIGRIVERIIVVGNCFEPGSLGNGQRRSVLIVSLPIEIVLWYGENDFGAAVG